MHQTVPNFFLREDEYVANSMFRINEREVHANIAASCLRYLIFCASHNSEQYPLLLINSWTTAHFEAYLQYSTKDH